MYKVTLINNGVKTVIHHPMFNELKLQSGQIKQGINTADSFSFTILPNNPGYHLINELKTLIIVENKKTGKIEFEGRVLSPMESMSEDGKFVKSFICESELGYLNDSCQRHGEYHNMTVKQFFQVMINNHNKDIAHDEIDKKFVVGNVTVTNSTDNVYRYLGYENTLESIFDKLINRLGGELKVRKENGLRYLDYLPEIGEVKTTEIKLTHNLKSIEKEVDPSQIITKLIPLGAPIESDDETATDASQARVTISSVNDGKDYIEDDEAMEHYSVVTKSEVWEDVTDPRNLLSRGRTFIKENNRVKIKYVLSAIDLSLIGLSTDSFETGNSYPVINPIMNINETLRVVEKTTDIINPNTNNLTIGDLFKTASQYQNEANRSQSKIVNLESTITRQARTIGVFKDELTAVNEAVTNLKNSDLPGIQDAVLQLQKAINDLNESLNEIPIYEPVTTTKDGLMISADKIKLDSLKNYQLATETVDGLLAAFDKVKLNLITVTKEINLDELESRVTVLERGTTNG